MSLLYRRLTKYLKLPANKQKTTLPEAIQTGLKNTDPTAKRNAFRQLTNRYISAHYKTLGMSANQMKRMEALLTQGRKKGMNLKPDEFKYCPSCDGACSVKE